MKPLFLIALLTLTSCSSLKCVNHFLDGKAHSSCKAFIQYEKECKEHGGIKYGNAIEATCNDESKITRKY